MEHYSNKVEMCKNDPKSLFQLANSLLVNQQQKEYLILRMIRNSQISLTTTSTKIARIRAHLHIDSHSEIYEQPLTDTKFTILRPTTSNEIRSLIMTSNN